MLDLGNTSLPLPDGLLINGISNGSVFTGEPGTLLSLPIGYMIFWHLIPSLVCHLNELKFSIHGKWSNMYKVRFGWVGFFQGKATNSG